jgi:hypothetical protein
MPVKCKFENCNKNASFNIPTETKVLYCSEHKLDEMVDVKHKKCLDCTKNPYFNYPDKKVGLYCSEHAKENMINIKSIRCKKCSKIASFAFVKMIKPEYCFDHKLDGMVDVTHKQCAFANCRKYPLYNLPNEKSGLYCKSHASSNMVDVMHTKCLEPNCMIEPHFNYEHEKVAIYCSKHKKDKMINIISKTCIFSNCKTLPNYNYPNMKTGLYCNMHKLEGMIDVKSKRCIVDNCSKRPIYNYLSETNGLYCFDHKKDKMIDVVNKRCIMELCSVRINDNKYDGYCLFCYIHLFPDKKITTNYKTKEKVIINFISDNFPDKTWIIDKKIIDGCSKRRPDLLLDLGYQVIIVEVDENQHIDYDCSCENKRLMEISQDLGHRNVVFIRFNPDDYIDSNNIKVKSCWKINSKGMLKLENKTEWTTRLNSLKEQIDYWCNNKTDKMIEIIQLYYNLKK